MVTLRAERHFAIDGALGAGALALAAVAAIPGFAGSGTHDPMLGLAWIGLAAAPVGTLIGGLRVRVSVALTVLFLLAALTFALEAPDALLGGAVSSGLFALGFGLGRARPSWRYSAPPALLLLGALPLILTTAVAPESTAKPPFTPGVRALLLDLSPATLAVEAAGGDWLRHALVYEPAGTSAMGPEVRTPWRGFLAGPALLIVGCLAAAVGLQSSLQAASKLEPAEED